MELLKCPDCGEPLYMEISEIRAYNITQDGSFLVRFVEGGITDSFRYEEALLCRQCGKEYVEHKDWQWVEGRIGFRLK